MEWIPDEVAENLMRRIGIEFDVETVEIEEIDVVGSLQSNSRDSEDIDQDFAERFKRQMDEVDAKFPMIVLVASKNPAFLYDVSSGNHRLAAYLKREPTPTTIDAYIATCSNVSNLALLTFELNNIHGKALTKQQLLRNARFAMNAHGLSVDAAAKKFAVTTSALKEYIRAQEIISELAKYGLRLESMPFGILKKLYTLRPNQPVMVAMGRICHKFPTTVAFNTAVDEVRAKETEAEKLAAVEEIRRTALSPQPSPNRNFTIRTKFLGCLTRIEKLTEGVMGLERFQIAEDPERSAVRKRVEALSRRLAAIADRSK